MTWLAFDVGTRRIGVALGSSLTGARPLEVLNAQKAEASFQRALQLLREWGAQGAVVGIPYALDGSEQPMTAVARAFAEALQARTSVPVELADERYSSKSADRRFAELRAAGVMRKKDAMLQDAMAAAMILENFLATRHE